MKIIFCDIETTGLRPEDDWVWKVVYARAVREENTLKLLEVVELVGKECIKRPKVKRALEWADLLIAHNVSFEKSFLGHRGLPVPSEIYCNMIGSTHLCEIPHPYCENAYKRPKLTEAISILGLEEKVESQIKGSYHDALYDVYSVLALYTFLEGLELLPDNHRKKTANLLGKYLTVRRYAVPKYRDSLVESLTAQSKVLRLFRRLSGLKEKLRRIGQEEEGIPF